MHRIILVASPDGDYKKELAPLDQNLKVEPHLEYTKEQLISLYREICKDTTKDMTEEELMQYIKNDYSKGSGKDMFLFDENDNLLSRYNNKAIYDYYCELGGKLGKLVDKSGKEATDFQAGDIDWKKTFNNFYLLPNIVYKGILTKCKVFASKLENYKDYEKRWMQVAKSIPKHYRIKALDAHI